MDARHSRRRTAMERRQRWLDMSDGYCSCQGVGPQRRPSQRSLAGVGGVRSERLAAEQERQRKDQERFEADRFADLE